MPERGPKQRIRAAAERAADRLVLSSARIRVSLVGDGLALHLGLCVYDERPFALVRLGLENAACRHGWCTPLPRWLQRDGGGGLAWPASGGRAGVGTATAGNRGRPASRFQRASRTWMSRRRWQPRSPHPAGGAPASHRRWLRCSIPPPAGAWCSASSRRGGNRRRCASTRAGALGGVGAPTLGCRKSSTGVLIATVMSCFSIATPLPVPHGDPDCFLGAPRPRYGFSFAGYLTEIYP